MNALAVTVLADRRIESAVKLLQEAAEITSPQELYLLLAQRVFGIDRKGDEHSTNAAHCAALAAVADLEAQPHRQALWDEGSHDHIGVSHRELRALAVLNSIRREFLTRTRHLQPWRTLT